MIPKRSRHSSSTTIPSNLSDLYNQKNRELSSLMKGRANYDDSWQAQFARTAAEKAGLLRLRKRVYENATARTSTWSLAPRNCLCSD